MHSGYRKIASGVASALVLAAALAVDCDRNEPAYAPRIRKVLLIGIDGVRPDALARASTPVLDGLIAEGAFADDTRILGDRPAGSNTSSGPGWSSILTGVWADKHGVRENDFEGKNFARYPHFFRRIKETLPRAETISLAAWAPIHTQIVEGADLSLTFPPKGARLGGAVSVVKGRGAKDRDSWIATEASRLLAEWNPAAMFLHFDSVDHAGHTYGFHPDVAQYRQAIEHVDAAVGRVLAAVAARPRHALEDWLVVVTTDHGGRNKGHGEGHGFPEVTTVFLIVSGSSARPTKIDYPTWIVDAPVTALAHLGVPLDPAWNLDGRPVGLR